MLTAERRAHLLAVLARDGKVVAKAEASALGLSEDTIRRDLRDLADDGLVQRVYGGALPASPAVAPYAERTAIAGASKDRVAAIAATLVETGSTVVLDGGTSALALARALPRDLRATVVTPSPLVAVALAEHTAVEILLLGGVLHRHSMVVGGGVAAEQIAAISADTFFLGVTGVHADAGLTTGQVEDAATKRALARRSAQTWVLASADKLGAASAHTVLPLGEVAGVIHDGAPHPTLGALSRAGVTLLPAASA